MKVYNPPKERLLEDLIALLADLRKTRGFDAHHFIEHKGHILNSYMKDHGLCTCVVATSGGVDSAAVLGLVSHAQKSPHSPIKKAVAVMLPAFDKEGATNQEEALRKGKLCAQAFGAAQMVVDITPIHSLIKQSVDVAAGFEGKAWASGQLVAYARTPALYYVTSLMSEQKTPSIICGTTNRDEGAYLGYVGKASDGMVDVQLIADLHKSEVYAISKALGVPNEILEAIPTGDMYDGRPDEDVFGAPYDFVELYLLYLCLQKQDQKAALEKLSQEGQAQFADFSARLENLHSYNKHKYIASSPAVHLNLYQSAVPGGWSK